MSFTFSGLLLEHARQRPDAPAMREKKFGIWQTTSWGQLRELVCHIAGGLHQLGLRRGEHLVLIGSNRPRLYATMLASQALGVVPVPLYQDAVASECVFPINNTEARFAVVEDQEQVDKMLDIRTQCPKLEHILFDEPRGLRNYDEPGLASLNELEAAGAIFCQEHPDFFQSEVDKVRPDDAASIFLTSGTTGNPKGVVHTHFSLINRAEVGARFDKLTDREEVLAYLPAAWIGQNMFSYAQWLICGYVINFPESSDTVMIDLKEIGPTYYFAPPRVFEGLLTNVMIRIEDVGALKRKMFHIFMDLARRVGPQLMNGGSVGLLDRVMYRLGDWLVYGPLRNNLGFARLRVAYTAGEAIGPDLFTFYRCIGINLKQLYGSTETAVFVCLQPDHEVRVDTVGVPCDGVEIKLSEQGEILVFSPGLLKEYYKNPQATAEVLDVEGWYHTSDAGFIDGSGHLKIIDRVKDVGRLEGGPNHGAMFAPKYVENKLKFFSYIKEAVAFGGGRAEVCAMVNIDFEAVGNWAERRGLSYSGYTDLAGKPEVSTLIKECVEKVNADLSRDQMLSGSQIHRFLILHKELDADDDELTRTNKVRRSFISEKYAVLLDALYSHKIEQYVETQVKFENGRTGRICATIRIVDVKTFAMKVAA